MSKSVLDPDPTSKTVMSVYLFVCLLVSLFVCLSVCWFGWLAAGWLPGRLAGPLAGWLAICLYFCLVVFLFVFLFVFSSVCFIVCQFHLRKQTLRYIFNTKYKKSTEFSFSLMQNYFGSLYCVCFHLLLQGRHVSECGG